MCRYTFWAGSVTGLKDEVTLIADNYLEALAAVKKHVNRQEFNVIDANTVKVNIECKECGEVYSEYEHIDCSGHKEMTQEQLIQCALDHDNKYRKFKKLHSKHIIVDGLLKTTGVIK